MLRFMAIVGNTKSDFSGFVEIGVDRSFDGDGLRLEAWHPLETSASL
jgi:hypothetical protein